ncbi:MAG: DUF642 domain-containing protein [Pontiellaceae bacterium]|nr:DUF642 domain-containing protein [Pontiellaceae bacterium]MBN2784449.1 DUF642 domain-containing protein [Pontiellaceae bacterium]
MKKVILITGLVGLFALVVTWRWSRNERSLVPVNEQSVQQHAAQVQTSPSDAGANPVPAHPASVASAAFVTREMDIAVNPYAGTLREAGRSKRAWDPDFIAQFQTARSGDPVQFELTQGVMAEGSVKILQEKNGLVRYVSGTLTAPETGTFFFLTPPQVGKAGKAVGVIEFPESRTAYRVEPTGPDGDPELWQRRLDEVVCVGMAEMDADMLEEDTWVEPMEAPPLNPGEVADYNATYNTNLNGTAIVSLQSLPGATGVMLLDFFGGYTPTWGGWDYDPPPVSNGRVRDIWRRVAEDYLPFNINVTTDIKVYQAAPEGSRQRCCFTTSPVTAAGVAYFGSWNWGGDTPCWSVYYGYKGGNEVASHEVGHTLGLSHQGQDIDDTHIEYYGGQGSGITGWAPIMGAGYYQPVTTWAQGGYSNPSQTEDELQIIVSANNNVAYRTDDTGDSLATSRYLEVYSNNTVFAEGAIERTADTDAFQFSTTGGAISLTAQPVSMSANVLYNWTDLAVMATLADSSGNVIASNNPQSVLSATINTTLATGTYTFRVTGTGRNDPLNDGFPSYGSLGYYSVSGTVAGARPSTRLTVDEHAPNNTAVGMVEAVNPNGSSLVYTIASGNTGGTFSVDNDGVVRVADNALLDYHTLAMDTLFPVQFELFMDIANVNDPSFTELNRRVVIAVQQLFPAAPTSFTATALPGLRVQLAWAGNGASDRYHVKRSMVSGGPYTTIANVDEERVVDADMSTGQTYYYVVVGVNENGEGPDSQEASATQSTIPNFSFELPDIGSGNYSYNPTGGFWTFNGSSGDGSGLIGNGSGFGNPDAPAGVQAAFVQSYGTISQTLSGFTPGLTYTISYAAAQRSGNSQTWDVKIDDTVIQSNNTPGGSSYTDYSSTFVADSTFHTLSFIGTDLFGGDNTVFIDNVRIAVVVSVDNFGFESPTVANYQYNPSGASWTFSGSAGNGSGILANGSGFSNPNAPEGGQVAFVQSYGTISQTVSGFMPGETYTVSYQAAQRSGPDQHGGESWNVMIDNTVIQSNDPGGAGYAFYSATFTASSTSHVLKFVGTDLAGGDNTVFIDNVTVGHPLEPVAAPVVTLTAPLYGSVFQEGIAIDLSASVEDNGNVINAVDFLDNGVVVGTVSNAPYALTWANAVPGIEHRVVARVRFNGSGSVDSSPVSIAVVNTDLNLGFEAPGISGHQYDPVGASWSFMNLDGDGSGLLANGSAFDNPDAPEGVQAAFLQSFGEISQTLAGFAPGTTYTITYMAAQRTGGNQHGGQTWNVMIDDSSIQEIVTPGGSSYTLYTTGFTATDAMHTLRFVGTDLPGDDNTVFLDNVIISPGIGQLTLDPDTLPVTVRDVVGSQIIFTSGISGGAPISYQWQKINGTVTNNIAGATAASLTLTDLQLSDSGSYRVRASNALGSVSGTPRTLTVSSVPAPVNNVIASMAAQTGTGSGTFTPTWTLAPGSLIAGQQPDSTGGNFSMEVAGRTVGSLTAGDDLGLSRISGVNGFTTSTNYVTCGNGSGAGASAIYILPTSDIGYDLTNITVYGGWADNGRDQQAYTVSYSTASDPSTFHVLRSVNYNPTNPAGAQSAARATLTASAGVLAGNVAAIKFDFTSPLSENGYVGYSEIQVFGVPSIPPAAATYVEASLHGGNSFVLNVGGTLTDRAYEVQSTTNLISGVWTTETNFTATATEVSITNFFSGADQKFYRVISD